MPLVRYFLFVGGTLLGLLFLVDRQLPVQSADTSSDEIDRSIIRIHSAREWPAAVPIDTSVPMPQAIATPTTAVADGAAPAKAIDAPAREAYAYVPPQPAKPANHAARKVRTVSRWPARNMRPRLASSQPNWFPAW